MDEKNYNDFSNLLEGMLNKYDKLEDKTEVNDFLEKEIKSSGVSKENNEIKKTVNEISSTIETIANKFNDLQEYKKQGKSREEWLEKEINSALTNFDNNEKSLIVKQIDDSIKKNKADFMDLLKK